MARSWESGRSTFRRATRPASSICPPAPWPRTKYLISSQVAGAPAFDPDGKILGIGTVDFSSGHASGIINLPSRDVAELAKQAAAVKPEEKLAEDAQGKDKAPAAAQPAAAPAADKP